MFNEKKWNKLIDSENPERKKRVFERLTVHKDFEETYEVRLAEKQPIWWKKFLTVACSVVSVAVLALCIAIPLIPQHDIPVYSYVEELEEQEISTNDFYEMLKKQYLSFIANDTYVIDSCGVLRANDKVQGGKVTISDTQHNATVDILFFDSSLSTKNEEYNNLSLTHEVNGAKIFYEMKSSTETLYEYQVKAEYKNTTYLMTYTSSTDNILLFFGNFFS